MKSKEKTELRILREFAGLKMVEAARMTNTAYKTWENWEKGRSKTPGVALAWLILYTQIKKTI